MNLAELDAARIEQELNSQLHNDSFEANLVRLSHEENFDRTSFFQTQLFKAIFKPNMLFELFKKCYTGHYGSNMDQ